jgi:hypothetical protein
MLRGVLYIEPRVVVAPVDISGLEHGGKTLGERHESLVVEFVKKSRGECVHT